MLVSSGAVRFEGDVGRRFGDPQNRGLRRAGLCDVWDPAACLAVEADSQASYRRLTARGKPHKVSIMRRLACMLNTLLREDRLWQAEPPSTALQAAA